MYFIKSWKFTSLFQRDADNYSKKGAIGIVAGVMILFTMVISIGIYIYLKV